VILENPEAVSRAAAERFAAIVQEAVSIRGRADVATTGGSTPSGLYRSLNEADLRASVPWRHLHLWFGDERFVRRADRRANVRSVDEARTGGAADPDTDKGSTARGGLASVPASHVHAMPVDAALDAGRGPDWVARRYGRDVRGSVPRTASGWPRFDLVIVGLGTDGHVLSVFPESPAFRSRAIALPVPAPEHIEPAVERITLNPRILDAAGAVMVVAHGAGKATILHAVLDGPRRERAYPAQRARRGGATWLVDAAAARELVRPA
jgi:6-phosphogluconolactonase